MSDWFDQGGSSSPVDVTLLLDSHGFQMLNACIEAGALVSIGKTSDGGALAITITVDGRWRREYFRDPEQLGLWMEEAMPPVLAACERRSASSGGRADSRRSRGR